MFHWSHLFELVDIWKELLQRTARTQNNSQPRQYVQSVPKTNRTRANYIQDNLYPRQIVARNVWRMARSNIHKHAHICLCVFVVHFAGYQFPVPICHQDDLSQERCQPQSIDQSIRLHKLYGTHPVTIIDWEWESFHWLRFIIQAPLQLWHPW